MSTKGGGGCVNKKEEREFAAFVGEFGDNLMRIGVLLTSDVRAAEDLYQETLQRLASRWSRIEHPRAFCRRVLFNLVLDKQRARSRRPREQHLPDAAEHRDPNATDPMTSVELRPALFAALDELTPLQRAVVVLRYFDDRSEAEVADLLGVANGTVKSTASRAVSLLRSHPSLLALFSSNPTY
jgi:RNA polymerase sigma-70 factor (sigma-E family)